MKAKNDKTYLGIYSQSFVNDVNQECLKVVKNPDFSLSGLTAESENKVVDLQGDIIPQTPLDFDFSPFCRFIATKEKEPQCIAHFPFQFECKFQIKETHFIERSRNSKTQKVIKNKTIDWYFNIVVDKKFDRRDIGQAIHSISKCGFDHGPRIYVGDKVFVAFRPKPYLSWTKILTSISKYLICYIPKKDLENVKKQGLNYPANTYNPKKLICHLPLNEPNILQTELKNLKKKHNYVAVGIKLQKINDVKFYFGQKENEYYTLDWIAPEHLTFFA